MDSDKINELLNRYWNCETSLEEEQQLRAFFRENEFPEQLKETAELFRYFDTRKKKTITDTSFDKEVLKKFRIPKHGKIVKLVYNSMRIAAGIAVLLVAGYLVRNEIRQSTATEVSDTYNDPKLAFEETKKALMMISKSFGSAEQKAKKINLFNEAQQQVQKEDESKSKL